LVENGKEFGLIRETKTGLFVALETTSAKRHVIQFDHEADELEDTTNVVPIRLEANTPSLTALNNRVFISHGKNGRILDNSKL